MLALAVASLESNDAEKALQLANEAQQRAARAQNKESQWLAPFIAARAQQRLGNTFEAQNQNAQAEKAFSEMRATVGEFAESYQARRDIEFYRKQPG